MNLCYNKMIKNVIKYANIIYIKEDKKLNERKSAKIRKQDG